jgi:hypothetical protein
MARRHFRWKVKVGLKRGLLWCSGVCVALLLVWLAYQQIGDKAPQGQPPLASLTQENFADFRTTFNNDAEYVRVVLLVSPT